MPLRWTYFGLALLALLALHAPPTMAADLSPEAQCLAKSMEAAAQFMLLQEYVRDAGDSVDSNVAKRLILETQRLARIAKTPCVVDPKMMEHLRNMETTLGRALLALDSSSEDSAPSGAAPAGDSSGLARGFCDQLVSKSCDADDATCMKRIRVGCGKQLMAESGATPLCEILVQTTTLKDNMATCVRTIRKEGQAIYDATK